MTEVETRDICRAWHEKHLKFQPVFDPFSVAFWLPQVYDAIEAQGLWQEFKARVCATRHGCLCLQLYCTCSHITELIRAEPEIKAQCLAEILEHRKQQEDT